MTELCQDGVDQRDYFYFMALGYYKLEVMTHIVTITLLVHNAIGI